jgi:uncharacterized spore protein YtfJ
MANEKEEIVIETPVSIGDTTLIPVARVFTKGWSRKGVSFLGYKSPVAVVVVSPAGKRALSPSGEEIPLESLIEETPGLAEVLEDTYR